MAEQHQFQAEVSRLLDIVANALYSDRDIFLRELISNASDACDRLRYTALTDAKAAKDISGDYAIRLDVDTEARTLKVIDNGIGMNKEELIENLGTIAHSGTAKLVEEIGKARKEGQNNDAVNLIGKFGVGFYSAFMVADKVEVISRKAGEETAWLWVSDGRGSYTIDETLKDDCGTEITLHINDEASGYLLEEKLRQIVKKYSDHIDFPIYFGAEGDGEPINSASTLWTRPKSEVTEEQYNEFYRHISGATSFDNPWMTQHWHAEGTLEYTCLLYIPGMKPFDLYDPKRENSVRLYVKRVFITDRVEGLVPPFLRFLRGVVDSQDLPLNISREMLQTNPVVTKIGSALTRRILEELRKKAETDPKSFEDFWALFGPVIKEGLYDAHQYRADLNKVVRFYSSESDGLVSFDDYIARMPDGQKHIYYLSGPDLETLRNSPQLEGYKSRGIEVLFMTDTIDEFWLPVAHDYDQRTFKSITRGGAEELAEIKAKEDGKKSGKKSKKPATPDRAKLEKDLAPVMERLKEILENEIKDIRISERLTESPVCLVAQENDVDLHMERMLKKNQGYEELSKRVMEINPNHAVIKKLKKLVKNDKDKKIVTDTAFLLLDQARIIEGDPLPDPAGFAKRMSRLMEQGLLKS
ncbi:MAG: molecular chaperone HtpG [Micavibrio sp.]|nr:MAG: molecular chaperone HtpG [Micavibrio sp.]